MNPRSGIDQHKIADDFGYVLFVNDAYKLIAEFETRSTSRQGFRKYRYAPTEVYCINFMITECCSRGSLSSKSLGLFSSKGFIFVNRLLEKISQITLGGPT